MCEQSSVEVLDTVALRNKSRLLAFPSQCILLLLLFSQLDFFFFFFPLFFSEKENFQMAERIEPNVAVSLGPPVSVALSYRACEVAQASVSQPHQWAERGARVFSEAGRVS